MEDLGKDEGEDIPSDFFDDFNKEEFIEGLSVIDSWDDHINGPRPRINTEAIESVKDLRELIRDGKPEKTPCDRERRRFSSRSKRSASKELDDLIKPGSRRDPSKTNEAIRRDKDAKVKEFLAKSLESTDDIRPPGTELDDFFEAKPTNKGEKPKRSRTPVARKKTRSRSREHRRKSPRNNRASPSSRRRDSPQRRRDSPRRHRPSPIRRRGSPLSRRDSPQRRSPASRYPSAAQNRRQLTRRQSPVRRSSPARRSSPVRRSPLRSPRRQRRSRSPYRRSPNCRSPNYRRSPDNQFLNLLLADQTAPRPNLQYSQPPQQTWDPSPVPLPAGDYAPPPGFYPNAAPLAGPGYPGYGGPPMGYDYGAQPVVPPAAPPVGYIQPGPPLPVPAPVRASVSGPPMVPAPQLPAPMPPVPSTVDTIVSKKTPYDALGQLLADGKISKEDYLKLTPNKGASIPGAMDLKEKVELLSRCNNAVTKLTKLHLPNRLVIHNNLAGQEAKTITPKFCSPLKRQPAVEFHFTQTTRMSATQQNKQLVDSIIATIGLDKVVPRLKKKEPKNMKDAAVQTTKPYCEVCTIREATKFYEAGTSIDPEQFSSSVHTQVLEQDLANSRAVFNPSGGPSDTSPFSIAHLTPAQLVSQLAARAKTLQSQPDQNQYMRRNPSSYDYDNHGGNQYKNNSYDYRY